MKLFQVFGFVIMMTFVSTILINMSVFSYVAVHDEGMVRIHNLSERLENDNILDERFADDLESAVENSDFWIPYLDILWFASFLSMTIMLWVSAYGAKREGYFSVLGILVIGVIAALFASGIFIELSQWFDNLIMEKVLMGYSVDTKFFTFYLDNAGLINMVIMLVAVLVNFIDFDFTKFGRRKEETEPLK